MIDFGGQTMFEYVIVADNYTRAAETASKFMTGGYRSSVTLDPESLRSMRHFTAVALDTETFFSSPKEAEKKLTNVARNLLPWKNGTVFFKRVEPLLQGNVGPEIRAMARELSFEYIVLVPALSHGRRSIEEGAVYRDNSEQASFLTLSATFEAAAEKLRNEGFDPVEVSLTAIREGRVAEIVKKKGCFCFDSESDEDLRAIVRGVLNVTPAQNVLWVGAMGLTEALAMAPKPFIVVVGTSHPRSLRQARQLLEYAMAYPVQLDASALGNGKAAVDAERTRVAEEAENLLRCGQSILLAGTVSGRFIRDAYPNNDINGFLGFIAETVKDIIGRVKIGGLCVTGGDCTARIVQKLKAESVVLVEEIQKGITLSRLSGGTFDGLPLIAKSGALGGELALIHCMEHFTQSR